MYEVERFLRRLNGKTLLEQFQSQHIRYLEKSKWLNPKGGRLVPVDGNNESRAYFRIWYCPKDPVEEILLAVGHELGHSFGFDSKDPDKLKPIWPHRSFLNPEYKEVEKFCDAFATAWLEDLYTRETLTRVIVQCVEQGEIFTVW